MKKSKQIFPKRCSICDSNKRVARCKYCKQFICEDHRTIFLEENDTSFINNDICRECFYIKSNYDGAFLKIESKYLYEKRVLKNKITKLCLKNRE